MAALARALDLHRRRRDRHLGRLFRASGELTSFGRMLDPIADKLLVASCLLMLAVGGTIRRCMSGRRS
jgi:hypothetical protein